MPRGPDLRLISIAMRVYIFYITNLTQRKQQLARRKLFLFFQAKRVKRLDWEVVVGWPLGLGRGDGRALFDRRRPVLCSYTMYNNTRVYSRVKCRGIVYVCACVCVLCEGVKNVESVTLSLKCTSGGPNTTLSQ